MLPLLHLLCMITVLPYLLLAAGFVFLGQAIKGSFWGFLDALLDSAAWLLSWGGLCVVAGYLAIVAMAFFQQTRFSSVIVGALLCLVTLSIVVFMPSTRMEFGQWLFLMPCIAALAIETWLVFHARSPVG